MSNRVSYLIQQINNNDKKKHTQNNSDIMPEFRFLEWDWQNAGG